MTVLLIGLLLLLISRFFSPSTLSYLSLQPLLFPILPLPPPLSPFLHPLPPSPSLPITQAYRLEPLLSQSYRQVKPLKVDSAGSGVSHHMATHASGTRMQEGQMTEKKGFLASLFGRDTKAAVKEPAADQVSCTWEGYHSYKSCLCMCLCLCIYVCLSVCATVLHKGHCNVFWHSSWMTTPLCL